MSIANSAAAKAPCAVGHGLSETALAVLDFDQYRTRKLAPLPTDSHYRLDDIRIVRQNVFPEPQAWFARLANRFNLLTRISAIRAALPFREGDLVRPTELQEAERILRQKPFFYDALVLPRQRCGAGLAVDVVVRDVWTLSPNIGLARSGGDNKINVGVTDANLLGSGKAVSAEYSRDRDRSGVMFTLSDPNVFNSRWNADLRVADNDDGAQYGARLSHPFYSLETRWAAGVSVDHFERQQDLELLGKDLFELDVRSDSASVFLARSKGRVRGWVQRQFLGYRYQTEDVQFPTNFPGPAQQSRRFSYPYVGWQWQQDRFVKLDNISRVGITEDLQLGWQGYAELGWAPSALGTEGNYLLSRADLRNRWFLGRSQLLSAAVQWTGRFDLDDEQTEALQLSVVASYLKRISERWRFYTRVEYVQTRGLLADEQLTLGGDSGLRGYDSRYQPGDRRALVTLEQRYHSDLTLFGLIRVGYAAFIDVGRAWFEEPPPAWLPALEGDGFGTLANAGLGLRLESIRTTRDRIVHIDLAKPLVDGPGVGGLELTISGKTSI